MKAGIGVAEIAEIAEVAEVAGVAGVTRRRVLRSLVLSEVL